MSTLNSVVEKLVDENNQPIQNLKQYGDISENAEFKPQNLPFMTFGKIMRTNNRDLSRCIRETYSEIFHDLCGVNILYIPGSEAPFFTEFYFAKNALPCPEGKISNLVDLTTDNRTDSLYFKKQVLNNRVAGKRYTINDETKVLLSDVMYGGRQANKPNNNRWNNFINEIWVPSNDISYPAKAGQYLVRIRGCFNLCAILRKIFGNRMIATTQTYQDPETNRLKSKNVVSNCSYEVRFIKYSFNEPTVFIMNLEQFDEAAVREMSMKENPVRYYNQSGVIYY